MDALPNPKRVKITLRFSRKILNAIFPTIPKGDKKQPYFIYRADGQPVFMAAIGSTPFERGDEAEGFLIVTAAADQGLVDIHDRRPLVLSPEAAREWMRQDIGGKEASEIAASGCVPANQFSWHPVSRAVGNVKNQGAELIQPVC